jgi:diacylglycerol kinase
MKSFRHACDGLKYLYRTQRNFRIHTVVAVLTIIFAYILHFTMAEWGALFAVIGLVFSAEAFNTAIERTVDCATEETCEAAKNAKDTAAAAVLLMSIMSVLVGIVLFGSKIIKLMIAQGIIHWGGM